MIRVLVIGYAPDAVDFSDPLVPKGIDEQKIAEGIEADARKMISRGWDAEHMNIRAGEDIRSDILRRLSTKQYDCIVVGGGVRVTTKRIGVLETVVNAIRDGAPHTPIAFNGGPDESAEAVFRILPSAEASC